MRILIAVLVLIAPARLAGQADLPRPVKDGLEALGAGNCEKALTLWTDSWTDTQKAQMAATCPALKQYGGSVHGYDVLRVVDISPHVRRVYAVLLYDMQPVYLMVIAYQPTGPDWKVGAVNWNTDPDQVIPPQILPPQRPKP